MIVLGVVAITKELQRFFKIVSTQKANGKNSDYLPTTQADKNYHLSLRFSSLFQVSKFSPYN